MHRRLCMNRLMGRMDKDFVAVLFGTATKFIFVSHTIKNPFR